MNRPKKAELIITIQVEFRTSCLFGQETFFSSTVTSVIKFVIFLIIAVSLREFGYQVTGLVGFEPTTYGFGDRRSASWSYRPITITEHFTIKEQNLFLQFFVIRMFATETTKFLELNAIRRLLFIFHAAIVHPSTFSALKLNIFPHYYNFLPYQKPPTGLEPVASSLPRTCSTG